MDLIEIDDEVLKELSARAVGFNVTPNDVIRQILGLPTHRSRVAVSPQNGTLPAIEAKPAIGDSTSTAKEANGGETTLRAFVDNAAFRRQGQTINRFLLLLWWAYRRDVEGFSEAVTGYQRGNRRHFGRTQQEVENSGVGIRAKEIPKTPFWVLATLDNKAKRTVIEDIFRALGHTPAEVNLAREQLPDTDIRRRRNFDLSILN